MQSGEHTGGRTGAGVVADGDASDSYASTDSDEPMPVLPCNACRRRVMGLQGGRAHTCGYSDRSMPVLTCSACRRRVMGLPGGRAHSCG